MPKRTKTIVIIVGAGKGRRFGGKDKAFITLNGKPVLAYAISPFEKSDLIDEIIIAVRRNKINSARCIVDKYQFRKVKKIVSGGRERQDSVYNALQEAGKADYVLIHDAARPLVIKKLIEDVLNAAKKFGAAIPAVPLKDTVKIGSRFVEKTLARGSLWLAQTPQAFEYKILKQSYENAKKNNIYTNDDASLVEKTGHKIKIISGNFENIKITVPSDLIIAETLIKNAADRN